MSHLPLTPEQAELAERIYQTLRQATDADLRGMAELLASKPDRQLLGPTEFEVRDRGHQIGARRLQTALDERKKTAMWEPGGPCVRAPSPGLIRSGSAGYAIRDRAGHEPTLRLMITSRHTGISGE